MRNIEPCSDLAVTALIEIPPAGALTNMAKRGLPGVEVLALKTPDQLSEAHRMISEHAQPALIANTPTWRMIIAPAKGIVSFTASQPGSRVPAGSVVAAVNTLRDTFEVTAPDGGQVIEWLVQNGVPRSAAATPARHCRVTATNARLP